jgi:hypothetical protein
MKFVNKLSALSLVVLMFSFMNVANADATPPSNCVGRQVDSCDQINTLNISDDKKAKACNNSYQNVTATGQATPTQCKWTALQINRGVRYSCLPVTDANCQVVLSK